VLLKRARPQDVRCLKRRPRDQPTDARRSTTSDVAAGLAGGVAVVGALAAVAVGLLGGDMAVPFAISAGLLALAVGSVLAGVANNLPAAAFGAVWLAPAHPASVIAYLIGTNVGAVATPHGSVATILTRAVGGRHGVGIPARVYLGSAWRYASAGAIAGILALVLATH